MKPKTKKLRVKITLEYLVWTTHTRITAKGAAKLIKRKFRNRVVRSYVGNTIDINNQYDWTQYDLKKITV